MINATLSSDKRNENNTYSETAGNANHDLYEYGSSGIQERQGRVPIWLVFVAIGLIVWAVYYTIRYWAP